MALDKPLALLNCWLQVSSHRNSRVHFCHLLFVPNKHCFFFVCLKAETAPPNFIQRLQSVTVRQGSQVRLDVRVAGIPTPVVKFYREGAEIQSSADFQIVQDGDLYSLLIAEAFPEDSGTYSVSASNSSGRTTSTAELLVQGLI